MLQQQGFTGAGVTPGGLEFGVQGWSWGDPKPKSITFFLDGTAMVSDQYGRPIRGAVVDGKEVFFATLPPQKDDPNSGFYVYRESNRVVRAKLATHAETVAALKVEGIDWKVLTRAGFPQLSYEELMTLDPFPETPDEELRKIVDVDARKVARRARKERDAVLASELVEDDEG